MSSNKNEFGPNYFGFYKNEVLNLFNQEEDSIFPFISKAGEPSSEACASHKEERKNECHFDSDFLFTDAMGTSLSEFKKERLSALLKQSVVNFNEEVDEIFDQILATSLIQGNLDDKKPCDMIVGDEDIQQFPSKKQKITKDLREPVEQKCLQLEKMGHRDLDDLIEKLGHMEVQLEEFLDVVTSKCRSMTPVEIEHLGQHILKLPSKALERIIGIVEHRSLSINSVCDEIQIDLTQQDTITLWRLHYYIKAVEKANK